MDIQIRTATINDYESVIKIISQVQDMHVEWRPDIYRHNDNLIPKEIFEKIVEGNTFFIAEDDDKKIVGFLEIAFRHIESPANITRDIIFIDMMAVAEKFRGLGVGHKMFEFLKKMKIEKNMDGIELQVNAKNIAAYELYRKYGFTEKSINMELLV